MPTAFAMALVAGLSVVPTATVMACDCARTELPEAVRDADLAIVGTLIGQSGAAARPGPPSSDGIAIPVPLLVAGAATVLLGLIGLVAFRRGSGEAG